MRTALRRPGRSRSGRLRANRRTAPPKGFGWDEIEATGTIDRLCGYPPRSIGTTFPSTFSSPSASANSLPQRSIALTCSGQRELRW
jgi:hypothetical protein